MRRMPVSLPHFLTALAVTLVTVLVTLVVVHFLVLALARRWASARDLARHARTPFRLVVLTMALSGLAASQRPELVDATWWSGVRLALRQVHGDHVERRAGDQLGALAGVDHVVWRRHDARQRADDRRIVVQGAQRLDIGHRRWRRLAARLDRPQNARDLAVDSIANGAWRSLVAHLRAASLPARHGRRPAAARVALRARRRRAAGRPGRAAL